MSDEVAFLNAIRANPDDDTTRLVYADWLDDRDDPRGAFVRLHLALRSVAPDRPFLDKRQHRVWKSLSVATDVLPLLVNACSDECIGQLPNPPANYVQVAHRGGPDLRQPATEL